MFSRILRAGVPLGILALLLPLILAACGSSDDERSDGSALAEGRSWNQPIVFADQGSDSAIFHNRVMQYVAEHGYGYETDAIPAETTTLVQGTLDNDIQVLSEMWLDQIPALIEAVDDGTVVNHGTNYEESLQGFFVPTYVIEGDEERGIEPMAPELQSVDDLPKYVELFEDPEQPESGRFYDCLSSWECSRINEAKFEFYGLDEHYRSFDPGSTPALDSSLVSAYERGEPWFGYYWAPTWIYALLDLTLIEEPEYTDECWEDIFSGEVGCAYPSVRVLIGSNAEFAEQAPDYTEFLDNYRSSTAETSEILLYIYENDSTREDAAIWWLEENEDVWSEWVTEEAAEGVKNALDQGLVLGD